MSSSFAIRRIIFIQQKFLLMITWKLILQWIIVNLSTAGTDPFSIFIIIFCWYKCLWLWQEWKACHKILHFHDKLVSLFLVIIFRLYGTLYDLSYIGSWSSLSSDNNWLGSINSYSLASIALSFPLLHTCFKHHLAWALRRTSICSLVC